MSLLTEAQMLHAFPTHMGAVRVPPGWKEFARNIEAATLLALAARANVKPVARTNVLNGSTHTTWLTKMPDGEHELFAAQPAEAGEKPLMAEAIDGAITYGRMGVNEPPAGHWLTEYWVIGQQLAELGKTSAWDNQTPEDTAALVAADALSTGTGIMRIDPAAALLEAARPILTRASAATVAEPSIDTDVPEAIRLLGLMFDGYENGRNCYEDAEEMTGFVGPAFRIDDEAFDQICKLLNRRNPPRYGVRKDGLVVPDAQQQAEPCHVCGGKGRIAWPGWVPGRERDRECWACKAAQQQAEPSKDEKDRAFDLVSAWLRETKTIVDGGTLGLLIQCGTYIASNANPQHAEPGANERAAFEAWARDEYGGGNALARQHDDYKFSGPSDAWAGWQARAELAAQSGQRAGVADETIERLALKHIAPHAKKFFPDADYKGSEQFRRIKAYTLELLAEAK